LKTVEVRQHCQVKFQEVFQLQKTWLICRYQCGLGMY